MKKFFFILKIIILKLIKLNYSFLKNEISGYPNVVKKFEENFAKFIGKKFGITFCNGTSSIEAAVYALGFNNQDEILVTSSTFHASLGPAKNLGCKLVFVDVDKYNFTIDCNDLEKKITKKSKGLIIVHPWGYPCEMDKILNIVNKYNLKLIEDCSHSHGAKYSDNNVGYYGDISCFSLQGSKSIKAGEGGIALTNNKNYFLKMSIYGHFDRHENEFKNSHDFKNFSKIGMSKKLRAHPLGISLASIDLKYISQYNKLKNQIYEKIDYFFVDLDSVKPMKVNKNAIRGGFFGGYPIFFKDISKIDQIIKTFEIFKLKLKPYPWMNHHKMILFSGRSEELAITEQLKTNLYLIEIPYFLNFNFSNLRKSISLCKKKNFI